MQQPDLLENPVMAEKLIRPGISFAPYGDYSPAQCVGKSGVFSPRPYRLRNVGSFQFNVSSQVPVLAEAGRPNPRTIEARLRLDDPEERAKILKKGHLVAHTLDIGDVTALPESDESGKVIVYRWEEPIVDHGLEEEDPNPLIVDASDLPELRFSFRLGPTVAGRGYNNG